MGHIDNSGSGGGNLVGPASATDNAIALFDTISGKLLKDSATTIADIKIQSALGTGLKSGGVVTINADPTKFDITAGTGIVVDWSGTGEHIPVSWNQQLAVPVTYLATDSYTSLTIDKNGLIKQYGSLAFYTPEMRRQEIIIPTLIHVAGTGIESVGGETYIAFNQIQSALDYIFENGPLHTGNEFSASGVDLTMDRASGTTTFPFANGVNDQESPTHKINSSGTDVTLFYNKRDGSGGFEYETGVTNVNPNKYDDGDGTLGDVPAGKWTIQRLYYFGATDTLGVAYGQTYYDSLAIARSHIVSASQEVFINFRVASYTTALIVQQGATDLSDVDQAIFEPIPPIVEESIESITFPTLNAPINDRLNEVFRTSLHPHVIVGCGITENGDGTIDVDAGEVLMRESNDITIDLRVVVVPASTSLTLTDNSANVIYVDYNAGTPIIKARIPVAGYFQTNLDEMPIGYVTRVGTNTHMLETNDVFKNAPYHHLLAYTDREGVLTYGGGLAITDKGTLKFSMASGYIFKSETTYCAVTALDTSVADTFTYIYSDGGSGWTRVTSSTSLVANNYDDGDGTLGSIGVAKFGVHWLYLTVNNPNELNVIYGTGSYSLAEAEAAIPRADLPPELGAYSTSILLAKVIIAYNGTTFTDILYPHDIVFQQSSASDHNVLSNLQIAASGVTYGHVNDQAQTFVGRKTFDDGLSYEGTPDGDGNALTDGATITPDMDNGDMMTVTLGGNRVLALPSNVKTFSTWMTEVKQDATGTRTLDTSAYLTSAGAGVTLTTDANAIDLLTFACFGTVSVCHLTGLINMKV